jgi:hypothetical protein
MKYAALACVFKATKRGMHTAGASQQECAVAHNTLDICFVMYLEFNRFKMIADQLGTGAEEPESMEERPIQGIRRCLWEGRTW